MFTFGGKKGGACTWCQMGECWTHGQVGKPAGKGAKGKGKAAAMGKGGMMAGFAAGFAKASGKGVIQSHLKNSPVMHAEALNAKALLNTFVMQHTKSNQKGAIVYETAQDAGGFVSTVQLVTVDPDTMHTGQPQASRKTAEASAAEAALRAHDAHPEAAYFAEAAPTHQSKRAQILAEAAAKGRVRIPHVKKETATDAKSRLNQAVPYILGKSSTKGDVVYTTETLVQQGPGQVSQYVSSVCLPGMGPRTYKGTQGNSKNEAEHSAAEAALKALNSKIAPLLANKAAEKKEKNKTQLAALKEKMKAKKDAEKTA